MPWADAGSLLPVGRGRALAEPMPKGAQSASTPGRAEPTRPAAEAAPQQRQPRSGGSPGASAVGDGRQRAPRWHGLPAAGGECLLLRNFAWEIVRPLTMGSVLWVVVGVQSFSSKK